MAMYERLVSNPAAPAFCAEMLQMRASLLSIGERGAASCTAAAQTTDGLLEFADILAALTDSSVKQCAQIHITCVHFFYRFFRTKNSVVVDTHQFVKGLNQFFIVLHDCWL